MGHLPPAPLRWRIDVDAIADGFVPDGTSRWRDEDQPAAKYWVVRPFQVEEFEAETKFTIESPVHVPAAGDQRPALRLVRAPDLATEPQGSFSANEETGPVTTRGWLRVVFVEVPRFYLHKVRRCLAGWC